MTSLVEVLNNVFTEPELGPRGPKEKMPSSCKKRYQLLDYTDVSKLSKVMETTVPVDGKGNFPALEVTPSELVQMVREGLSKEGIRVPNVRLNGSAATHVLSEDGKHTYKDLDLIFAVDLAEHGDTCSCGAGDHSNANDNNNYGRVRNAGARAAGKKHVGQRRLSSSGQKLARPRSAPASSDDLSRSPSPPRKSQDDEDALGGILPSYAKSQKETDSALPTSPRTILDKPVSGVEFSVEDVDFEDAIDKDSGYTSSESSSVSSLSASPAGWSMRSRTHSLDSASSVTSSSSRMDTVRQKVNATPDGHLDVHPSKSLRKFKNRLHHDSCSSAKEYCWQKIKDVVMAILRDLLPVGVSRTRMTDAVLTDAYVQKMVKINNDVDRWSLISLNNNAGRNLELKFVETMRRQYEFSVDSFQIILDSYQRFKIVSKSLEDGEEVKISPLFYPSVLAESVYGDFAAALRHLRHRRICTHRPEEIRGGGLLRYCNLLVRDFVPGEVEGYDGPNPGQVFTLTSEPPTPPTSNAQPCGAASSANTGPRVTSQSYSSSRREDVRRLEQLMCSRFFIDFSEFPRQQQKLLSYLESHFACEEDLKFEYLLIVRGVVDKNTVCLMSEERTMIIEYITTLARQTLAKNVAIPNPSTTPHPAPGALQRGSEPVDRQYQAYIPTPTPPYAPTRCYPAYPLENPYSMSPNRNNCNNVFYPQCTTVQPDYAPPVYPASPQALYQQPAARQLYQPFYIPHPYDPTFQQPHVAAYPSQPPVSVCPCCRAVYPNGTQSQYQCNVYVPPAAKPHTMSAESAPFFPAQKTAGPGKSPPRQATMQPVYLSESSKLYYSPAPPSTTSGSAGGQEGTATAECLEKDPAEDDGVAGVSELEATVTT